MKVLFIGKYPPIEGGVSANSYWLARGLAEQGVKVTFVTNALCVEDEYRIALDLDDEKVRRQWEPKNVEVRSLHKRMPMHIPYSSAYVSRLVNEALAAIGTNTYDAMYAHYLEPYGSAALFLKLLTGMPYVVRHAGSDIYRLLANHDLRYLLSRVLSGADRVLLTQRLHHLAASFGIKEAALWTPRRSLHPSFSPEGEGFDFTRLKMEVPKGVPVILYLGKAGPHKMLLESVDALARIKEDFRFLMVTQGELAQELEARIAERKMEHKIFVRRFIAPWDVPALLRSARALVHLEHDFPIPIHGPSQPHEAIACGTPLILSGEMYDKISRLYPEKELFTVVEDPSDEAQLRKGFTDLIINAEKKKAAVRVLAKERRGVEPWDDHLNEYVRRFEELSRLKR